MLCANQSLEPILDTIAQDTGVSGTFIQRMRDRLFAVVPDEAEVCPDMVASRVVGAAEKRDYRPSDLAVP